MATGHGHTVAAWVAVIIMLLGFTVGAIAFFIPSVTVFWIGAALILIGPAVGMLLKKLGYGQQA